jgi:RsiW-degrading membrane proteinase PrsW (M82 family)
MALDALIALLPVVACLVAFQFLDVFKLVSGLEIVALLAGGAVLAAASYFVNGGVLDQFPIGFDSYTRIVAPIVEESLKGGLIMALFALNRIGYLIDAAIAGFGIGAGFALAENFFYLQQFAHANLGVWVVRGFGTAVMHGGATAIFSVLSLALFAPRLRVSADRFRFSFALFAPGLAAAIAMHAAFNHFHAAPVIAMAVVLLATPLSLFAIFALGETHAHRWLAQDRDAHAALLAQLQSGAFADTEAGRALMALADRLEAGRGQDLIEYVRINAELAVRADSTLLALEAHQRAALGAETKERFLRLHDLERSLGRTAVMAVRQHLRFSRDDLWKMHELEMDSGRRGL